ncbi:MAG: hemolysin III family protein [Pseudomonadales bacterium]
MNEQHWTRSDVARAWVPRAQSQAEELANSVSHGAGLLAAIAATPYLISQVVIHSDTSYVVGTGVFAVTMILLYLSSTLYHTLPPGKNKRVFRTIEHAAIFLLIAGTYTPLALGVVPGASGTILLALIWGLAAIGVTLKLSNRLNHPIASVGLYLFMGWLILIAIDPLYSHLGTEGMFWLVSGGIAYTVGVAFFATDSRLLFGHFIWHLFVMLGSGCHYLAVLALAS